MRNRGSKEPCGECHLKPGEICDICGAIRATSKDMRDAACSCCDHGRYVETSQHDDMDGVLHCDKCGHRVTRHAVTE